MDFEGLGNPAMQEALSKSYVAELWMEVKVQRHGSFAGIIYVFPPLCSWMCALSDERVKPS